MKNISIQGRSGRNDKKEIALGNGRRINFTSKRQAGYFVAETNRFLTECLVIVNEVFTNALIQYRTIWFVASNCKGTNTNYLEMQRNVKSNLLHTDFTLDKFNETNFGSNDSFFSFIDLKKAINYLHDACAQMELFNQERNLTAAMYQCRVLRKRCLLVIQKLNEYGEQVTN